jgi:prepilin-type processing-associated H-X9-DG protein
MLKKNFENRAIAITQILILVIGTIAIAYAIGSEIKVVGAAIDLHKTTIIEGQPSSIPQIPTLALQVMAANHAPSIAINPTPAIKFAKFNPGDSASDIIGAGVGGTITLDGKTYSYVEEAGKKTWYEIKGSGDIPPVTDEKLIGTLEKTNNQYGIGKGLGVILRNAGTALTIWAAIRMIGPIITGNKQLIDSASNAIAISYFTVRSAANIVGIFSKSLATKVGTFLAKTPILGLSYTTLIGIGLSVAIFLLTYKKTQEQRIDFTCQPWDAPTGGANCASCNKGLLPCTEYQCRSLGQACEIINEGTTDQQCVWKNRNDVNPPEIQPLNDALLNKDYSYTPNNAVSPPDRGVIINYKGGCIPAFTPFNFGIKLNEPGKCKIDPVRRDKFDDMQFFFGDNQALLYNHTQTISLPGPDSLTSENITLQNDGNFNLYVRCADANGNSNTATFVFKYCVDKGPDTTPPEIIGSNLNQTSAIAYNQSSIYTEIYTNEPAECKWNRDKDTGFDSMEGTMKCSSSVFEMNAQMLYKCSTNLVGLQNRQANDFYFRCKDKPMATKDRNVNTQGYKLTILGTQPLVIDGAGPNETVRGSTSVVKVTLTAETSAGYNEGDATCYYSESCYKTSGSKDRFVAFSYPTGTSSYTHSQDLSIAPGSYDCMIKCIDFGGNADQKEIKYKVEVDNSPPTVIRAYHDGTYVKIITDENAQCVYGISDCNYLFADGNVMRNYNETQHYADWDSKKTYYIKCQDDYGNQPLPNVCSIIVRPGEDYK